MVLKTLLHQINIAKKSKFKNITKQHQETFIDM